METFDIENGDFQNPLAADATRSATARGLTDAEKIAANEEAISEAELEDLTYAFQAADMDGGGSICINEFELMLSVMGCDDLDTDVARHLILDAKKSFAGWLRMADEKNMANCERIWSDYDADKSGSMDLGEINSVISALRNLGSDVGALDAGAFAQLASDGESLTRDEFTAWYLKQEGLPNDFHERHSQQNGLTQLKLKAPPGTIERRAVSRIPGKSKDMFAKVVDGPVQLVILSAKVAKQGGEMAAGVAGAVLEKVASDTEGEDGSGSLQRMQTFLDAHHTDLTFAELVFMMRSGVLKPILPGDWQDGAELMRKLRLYFDSVDVNADNQLTRDEMELVIQSITPKVEIAASDLTAVWATLNPLGQEWISFETFAEGMVKVQRDAVLSEKVPMHVPNRFGLLSLLIDRPINTDQEALLFSKMNILERTGITLLERMGSGESSKEETRHTLDQACAGKLHCLTEDQRSAVYYTHVSCIAQACLIACVTCGFAGLWENMLVLEFETDGLKWAYWKCNDEIADVSSRDSPYYNLSLPLNPGDWSSDTPYFGAVSQCTADGLCTETRWDKNVPFEGRCIPGSCAAYPLNVTQYLLVGGNEKMGGNWTPTADGWDGECVSIGITDPKTGLNFMLLNFSMITIMIVFELMGLGFTALRSAVQVSKSLDLRLTPLNADRAFVANMLVRSVFELGDAEGAVLGVDATGEEDDEVGCWDVFMSIMAVVWIKGKVILTGVAFKALTAKYTNVDTATWIKPFTGTMLATMLWDSMMCHAIMKGAEMKAIGVTTAVECFNEVMDRFCPLYESDPASLSEIARTQVLRAIGVAIVTHGSMFPTMEILLRHAVDYLSMKRSKAVTQGGIIDNTEDFVADFSAITLDESRAVLCIHMLTYILDGSISRKELKLWKKITCRVDEVYQAERARIENMTALQLRSWIVMRIPWLETAVSRVPVSAPVSHEGDGGTSTCAEMRNDRGRTEMEELRELARMVPMPEHVTTMGQQDLIPRVMCQKFRANRPMTEEMLFACVDPETNSKYLANAVKANKLFWFFWEEFTYKLMSTLTAQV